MHVSPTSSISHRESERVLESGKPDGGDSMPEATKSEVANHLAAGYTPDQLIITNEGRVLIDYDKVDDAAFMEALRTHQNEKK